MQTSELTTRHQNAVRTGRESGSHKPKIAIVSQSVLHGGGVRTMVRFLFDILQKSGRFDPALVSLAASFKDRSSVRFGSPSSWHRGVQKELVPKYGTDVWHVGALGVELETQRYQPRPVLTELLNQFDLIQIVAGYPAVTWTAAHVTKPKCVFAATTVDEERVSLVRHLPPWRRLWLKFITAKVRRIEVAALGIADHVFAESDYTRRLLAPHVENGRMSLAVPGVDTSVFHPADRYHNNGHILSVGRFADPRKNVALLLRSYAQLRTRRKNVPRLVLAGRDGLSSQARSLAESLQIAPYLDVYSDISVEQLAALYRDASLFVLSSNEEGLGIVILEAMASGLPVVATDCGGPATCIDEHRTGFLVPVADSELMTDRMARILDSPSLAAAMGRAAREKTENRYSRQAAGRVYLDKYDELLRR